MESELIYHRLVLSESFFEGRTAGGREWEKDEAIVKDVVNSGLANSANFEVRSPKVKES